MTAVTGREDPKGILEETLYTKLWLNPVAIEVRLEEEEETVIEVHVTDDVETGEKMTSQDRGIKRKMLPANVCK